MATWKDTNGILVDSGRSVYVALCQKQIVYPQPTIVLAQHKLPRRT